ncbi:MAG TPA: tetratricopeptide repeat protein [Candidatus Kapabacteria bacterium]
MSDLRAALFTCIVIFLAAVTHCQPLTRSEYFAPTSELETTSKLEEFRTAPFYLQTLTVGEGKTSEPVFGYLSHIRSLRSFEHSKLQYAINSLRAMRDEPGYHPNTYHADLLTALELLSSGESNRTRAREILESIPEDAFPTQAYLLDERNYRLAECYMLERKNMLGKQYYGKVVASNTSDLSFLSRVHLSELHEKTGDREAAIRELDTVASLGQHTPFAYEASIKRLSLLLLSNDNSETAKELERAERLSTSIRTNSIDYNSEFGDWLRGSTENDVRIFSTPATDASKTDTIIGQYATPLNAATRTLLKGIYRAKTGQRDSALSLYDEALRVSLRSKDSSLEAKDEREFIRYVSRYERAWALYESKRFAEAAGEFSSLASEAGSATNKQASQLSSLREQGRYGDNFFEEFESNASPMASASEGSESHFYYRDIPERSRYYGAIALSRAGKDDEARSMLTALSQDKTALYADKASYHLALVEFRSGRTYQAEALLKPLAMKRTQSGVYASLLLGDLMYRRASYGRSYELMNFALENMPRSDSTLKPYTHLIRGLSGIPLGLWDKSSQDLEMYIRDANATGNNAAIEEALFQYGWACLRSDSTRNAASCFRTIIEKYPRSDRAIDAQYGYAWSLFKESKYQQAEKEFYKILEQDTISRYAYDLLSRVGDGRYAQGDYQKALKIYNLAVDRPTFDRYLVTRAMFQLGLARMRSDSSRSAMNAFNYIITKQQQSDLVDRSYYNYAIAAYAIIQNDKAEWAVGELLKQYPNSPYASKGLYLSASQAERRGEDSKALVSYKRFLKEYPNADEFRDALFSTLDLQSENKKESDAIALASQYLREDSLNKRVYTPELLIKKGQIETQAKKYDNAITTFQSFKPRFDSHALLPFSYYYTGRTYAKRGSEDMAKATYQEVIDSFPASDAASFALLELARVERESNNLKEAAGYYTRAFDYQYFSSDAAPQAMFEYAQLCLEKLNNEDSAITVFDELTKRYLIETSVGGKAQIEIADILLGNGKESEAISRLDKLAAARKGDPMASDVYLKLAGIYRRTGSNRKALAAYDNAREEASCTTEQLGRSLVGSAEMLLATGDKRRAKTLLRSTIDNKGVPREYRIKASSLWDSLQPKKKKKASKKH